MAADEVKKRKIDMPVSQARPMNLSFTIEDPCSDPVVRRVIAPAPQAADENSAREREPKQSMNQEEQELGDVSLIR
jgi:hypothetical protein